MDRWGRRMEHPVPPADVSEAVVRWFRDNGGRHARLEWHGLLGCWVIHVTRRSDDPLQDLVRTGRIAEATESIALHRPAGPGLGYAPMDLEQMGVSGVLEMLDRSNTWSGRGEYASLAEAVAAHGAAQRAQEEKMETDAYDNGRHWGAERRRHALGIPVVPVGIDLNAPQPKA